jgi:PIN domain nuclease of toxin-antitoxin system
MRTHCSGSLPMTPFDRLLAAQALAEDMTVVTRNRVFKKYGVKTIW